MQRIKTFLVVCISIVFCLPAFCQRQPLLPAGKLSWSGIRPVFGGSLTTFSPYQQGVFFPPKGAVVKTPARPPFQALEDDYYTRHFGFMCKKELEFEKTTHIPLRFRLGSLEQCNYLEGKR